MSIFDHPSMTRIIAALYNTKINTYSYTQDPEIKKIVEILAISQQAKAGEKRSRDLIYKNFMEGKESELGIEDLIRIVDFITANSARHLYEASNDAYDIEARYKDEPSLILEIKNQRPGTDFVVVRNAAHMLKHLAIIDLVIGVLHDDKHNYQPWLLIDAKAAFSTDRFINGRSIVMPIQEALDSGYLIKL